MTNRIGRVIFALLLAVAIAMLPASMGFAGVASTTGVSAAQAMPDCDHHQHRQQAPSKETHKTAGHSTGITGCALCFGFVGPMFTGVVIAPPASATLKPLRARTDLSSLMGSPPFRPPRA